MYQSISFNTDKLQNKINELKDVIEYMNLISQEYPLDIEAYIDTNDMKEWLLEQIDIEVDVVDVHEDEQEEEIVDRVIRISI